MMEVTPIVVVAYNRAKSLKRLLKSLANAVYERNDIPLIISIDKGDNADVLKVAEDFVWEHGEKTVDYQPENLKLRKHIIKCADRSIEYGSVIILEDDLYVSPYFYKYTTQALEFSEDKDYVGGISLYYRDRVVGAYEPFLAIDDKYDNWYSQYASSWGEAWTKAQWLGFKEWYKNNCDKDLHDIDMPTVVADWSPSSWLKYFIKYLIETDKYFIYPKKSVITNFGDSGTHVNASNTDYQVFMQLDDIEYKFSELEDSKSVYDAFFENIALKSFGEFDDVCVDLYGYKPNNNHRYYLTRRLLNYKILKTYGCCLRPHELNVINDIEGTDFFLYDTFIKEKNPYKQDKLRKLRYNIRGFRSENFVLFIKWFGKTAKNKAEKIIKRK